MAPRKQLDDGTQGGDSEDFAYETRIVDVGRITEAPPEVMRRVPRCDPLPRVIQMVFSAIAGQGAGRTTVMTKPIVMLGRVAGIADVAVDDAAASRYHACVTHQTGRFILTDMGSTNGTFVNRRRIEETELHSGDDIQIGVTIIRFEVAARG